MAKEEAFWNRVHRAFDPGEILVGQRSHELYCEREHSPLKRMRLDFRPGLDLVRPPVAYFTGHRGSGKSSMLWRLLESFRDDYFIVYFDIDHNLDSSRANQIDLLYLLGATIFQVAVQEGLDPDPKLLKELADSVDSLAIRRKEQPRAESIDVVKLATNLICFGASALGGRLAEKTAEKLTKAFLEPFHFSSGVSEERVRERQIEPQVQKIITNVNFIIAEVKTKAERDLLVVVDGLDKLQRLDQAKLIFLESNALRGPLCRIIYTVPMLIYTDLAFGQTEEECRSYLLPNVKIYEKSSGRKYRRGHETLQEVVARRLQGIEMVAGDLFEPQVLDLLIRKSGGVMRWFIGLVQDACTYALSLGLDKVNRDAAQRAVNDHAAKLTFRLKMNAAWIEELREIRQHKMATGEVETAELLQSLMIVAYFNGGPWLDAHPLIWEALKE